MLAPNESQQSSSSLAGCAGPGSGARPPHLCLHGADLRQATHLLAHRLHLLTDALSVRLKKKIAIFYHKIDPTVLNSECVLYLFAEVGLDLLLLGDGVVFLYSNSQ